MIKQRTKYYVIISDSTGMQVVEITRSYASAERQRNSLRLILKGSGLSIWTEEEMRSIYDDDRVRRLLAMERITFK